MQLVIAGAITLVVLLVATKLTSKAKPWIWDGDAVPMDHDRQRAFIRHEQDHPN